MGCSSSRTAPAWVPPTGCSPSGTGCSSVGPPRGHKPCSKPALVWASLSTGPQVLAGTCSSAGSPQGHRFLQASTCSGVGSLPQVQVEICSTVYLHGLQGHSLPHRGLHHELQGKALCSHISSTSSPSFFTDLGVCRVVPLTSSHSSLFTAVSPQSFFLPVLKYVIPELMGLAWASGGSILEPAGTSSVRHGGSFWQLLTEATPIASLNTKTLPHKPVTPS